MSERRRIAPRAYLLPEAAWGGLRLGVASSTHSPGEGRLLLAEETEVDAEVLVGLRVVGTADVVVYWHAADLRDAHCAEHDEDLRPDGSCPRCAEAEEAEEARAIAASQRP